MNTATTALVIALNDARLEMHTLNRVALLEQLRRAATEAGYVLPVLDTLNDATVDECREAIRITVRYLVTSA